MARRRALRSHLVRSPLRSRFTMATIRAEDRPAGVPRPNGVEGALSAYAEAASPEAIARVNGRVDLKHDLHKQLLAVVPPDRVERLSERELRLELVRLMEELADQEPGSLDHHAQE